MKSKILFLSIILVVLVVMAYFLMNNKKDMKINTERLVADTIDQPMPMKLISSVFGNNKTIPTKYGYKNSNVNPPLSITNVPKKAKSLALIMDDPDSAGNWTHWIVWNIPATTTDIGEGLLPQGAIQGTNDFHKNEYDGPVPPSGTHRYFFTLYALDTLLTLDKSDSKADLMKAMNGHILEHTILVGLFSK